MVGGVQMQVPCVTRDGKDSHGDTPDSCPRPEGWKDADGLRNRKKSPGSSASLAGGRRRARAPRAEAGLE